MFVTFSASHSLVNIFWTRFPLTFPPSGHGARRKIVWVKKWSIYTPDLLLHQTTHSLPPPPELITPTKCKGSICSSHHGYLSPAKRRNPEEKPPAWLWAHSEGGKWHIWRRVQGTVKRAGSHSLSPELEISWLGITWLFDPNLRLSVVCFSSHDNMWPTHLTVASEQGPTSASFSEWRNE